MKNVLEKLRKLSNVPEVGTDEFKDWREQNNNAMKFLHQNAEDDWCVVYSGSFKLFIHGVLVPEQTLKPLDIDDLLGWNLCNPYNSWSIASSDSKTWIEPPLSNSCSKAIAKGEQLVFARDHEGSLDNSNHYIEISQKFTHALGLHHRLEQKAWCKSDKNGDVKPFIKVEEIPEEKKKGSMVVVLFDRDLLSAYAALTNSVLVRMFDFPAYYETAKLPHIYYRISKRMVGNFYRGVQLLKSNMTKKKAEEIIGISSDREEKYETFTALDWQNKRVVKMSCSTEAYNLLPAFFRQEVLAKYKVDQNKYSFSEYDVDSTPYCINDDGQVCVWLGDLGKMSYKEQQHWKLYNEEPLPTITDFDQKPEQILASVLSKGFFESQVKGSWDYQRSLLSAIKGTLRELYKSKCSWWKTDSLDRINQINYPIVKSPTDSADWEREILALNRLVVEGLQDNWLKNKIKELEQNVKGVNGSLNLLEKYLEALGHNDVSEIFAPMRELKKLRNRASPAHEQLEEKDKQEAQELKTKILEKHGSYWKHYDYLVGACNKTFLNLKEIFEQEELNL